MWRALVLVFSGLGVIVLVDVSAVEMAVQPGDTDPVRSAKCRPVPKVLGWDAHFTAQSRRLDEVYWVRRQCAGASLRLETLPAK